jgi:hypothetical protein
MSLESSRSTMFRSRLFNFPRWLGLLSSHNGRFRSNGPDTDRTRTGPFHGSYPTDSRRTVRGPVRQLSVGQCPSDVNRETDRSVSCPPPVRVRSVRSEPAIRVSYTKTAHRANANFEQNQMNEVTSPTHVLFKLLKNKLTLFY